MWQPGRKPTLEPNMPWYESLDLPGAQQMAHVRKLMESRPMLERVPDQSLVVESSVDFQDRIQATRGNGYAFVYSASGQPFEVRMGKISGKKVKAYWYNPRTGTASKIGKFRNSGTLKFTPPSQGKDSDWVLVLDDSKGSFKKLY